MWTAVVVWWMMSRVSIVVTPHAVMVNSTLRITRTVPRHPDNRWLSIVVPDVTSSTRQLDGDAEKITHIMYVPHIPCDVQAVLCDVEDNLGKHYPDKTSITVAGCGE